MIIKLLNEKHQAKLIPFLEKYVDTNMFMLNNFEKAGFNPNEKMYAGDYFGLFNATGDTLLGVMAHYNNGGLMLQVPKHTEIIEDLTKATLSTTKRPIHAILGDEKQVDAVLETLNIPDKDFDLKETETLLTIELNHLKPIEDEEKLQLIHNKNMPNRLITEWMVEYDIEALGTTPSEKHRDDTAKEVETEEHSKNRWGLKEGDNFVAYGGFNALYKETVQVGPMWTPPALRGKGYARKLLNRMLHWAKEQGHTRSILFTNNPQALRSYKNVGYTECGAFKLCLLNKRYQVEE